MDKLRWRTNGTSIYYSYHLKTMVTDLDYVGHSAKPDRVRGTTKQNKRDKQVGSRIATQRARRISAALNYCRGIPTRDLEKGFNYEDGSDEE